MDAPSEAGPAPAPAPAPVGTLQIGKGEPEYKDENTQTGTKTEGHEYKNKFTHRVAELIVSRKEHDVLHGKSPNQSIFFDVERLGYMIHYIHNNVALEESLAWLEIAYLTIRPSTPWWLLSMSHTYIPVFTQHRDAQVYTAEHGLNYRICLQKWNTTMNLTCGTDEKVVSNKWASTTLNEACTAYGCKKGQYPSIYDSVVFWMKTNCRNITLVEADLIVMYALPTKLQDYTDPLYVQMHTHRTGTAATWNDIRMYVYQVWIVSHSRYQYYQGIHQHFMEARATNWRYEAPLVIPKLCVGFEFEEPLSAENKYLKALSLTTLSNWGKAREYVGTVCQPHSIVHVECFMKDAESWSQRSRFVKVTWDDEKAAYDGGPIADRSMRHRPKQSQRSRRSSVFDGGPRPDWSSVDDRRQGPFISPFTDQSNTNLPNRIKKKQPPKKQTKKLFTQAVQAGETAEKERAKEENENEEEKKRSEEKEQEEKKRKEQKEKNKEKKRNEQKGKKKEKKGNEQKEKKKKEQPTGVSTETGRRTAPKLINPEKSNKGQSKSARKLERGKAKKRAQYEKKEREKEERVGGS
jgi:hypothetical protein